MKFFYSPLPLSFRRPGGAWSSRWRPWREWREPSDSRGTFSNDQMKEFAAIDLTIRWVQSLWRSPPLEWTASTFPGASRTSAGRWPFPRAPCWTAERSRWNAGHPFGQNSVAIQSGKLDRKTGWAGYAVIYSYSTKCFSLSRFAR